MERKFVSHLVQRLISEPDRNAILKEICDNNQEVVTVLQDYKSSITVCCVRLNLPKLARKLFYIDSTPLRTILEEIMQLDKIPGKVIPFIGTLIRRNNHKKGGDKFWIGADAAERGHTSLVRRLFRYVRIECNSWIRFNKNNAKCVRYLLQRRGKSIDPVDDILISDIHLCTDPEIYELAIDIYIEHPIMSRNYWRSDKWEIDYSHDFGRVKQNNIARLLEEARSVGNTAVMEYIQKKYVMKQVQEAIDGE